MYTDNILNYCRWIIWGNNVVKYNVGDDLHYGWYKDEYCYWRQKYYMTHEVKQGVQGNCTILGHTNENYDLSYLNNFMPSAYK